MTLGKGSKIFSMASSGLPSDAENEQIMMVTEQVMYFDFILLWMSKMYLST